MSKLEFKAEEFNDAQAPTTPGQSLYAIEAARIAQAIYDNYLETLPKVEMYVDGKLVWFGYGSDMDTHTARLDAMEKIKK